jgi:hypothetical protein
MFGAGADVVSINVTISPSGGCGNRHCDSSGHENHQSPSNPLRHVEQVPLPLTSAHGGRARSLAPMSTLSQGHQRTSRLTRPVGIDATARTCSKPSGSPPTATGTRARARRPSGPLARGPPAGTWLNSSWLHPLKGWSLRITRRGSLHLLTSVGHSSSAIHGLLEPQTSRGLPPLLVRDL